MDSGTRTAQRIQKQKIKTGTAIFFSPRLRLAGRRKGAVFMTLLE